MRSVIVQEFFKSFPIKDGDVKEVRDIFKKINKEKKFAQKVLGMVKEVEGKTHSIAECWKWQKGLLVDFISLKKENSKIESLLEK